MTTVEETDDAGLPRVAALALAATILAFWMLQHFYSGIWHDGQLYLIQALARVMPRELGQDLFLRFGSQDRFTFFSPLYAWCIEHFGIAVASATLTFLSQAAFIAALVWLARQLMTRRLAWLAVGLVCFVPLTYGARKVFYVAEDFLTPRLLAEALVIAGLAAALARRYVAAVLLTAVGAALHPIMAAAGFVMLVLMPTTPKALRVGLLAAMLAGVAGLSLLAEQPGFDPAWWQLAHDGLPYLFPLEWRTTDWTRVLVVSTALGAGVVVLRDSRAREVCRAALIAAWLGIALSVVGADVLRLLLPTQLQPWRILWLSTTLALFLSPAIGTELWRRNPFSRAAAILLVAAYLLADERYALPAALAAALLMAAALFVELPARHARIAQLGSLALLVLAVAVNLLSGSLVARALLDPALVPDWLHTPRLLIATGAVPALVLWAAWIGVQRAPRLSAAVAGVALLAVAVLAAPTLAAWRATPFNRERMAMFAPWRAMIPVGSEVLWFDDPAASWILLERPSYISNVQTASSIFSRAAAMESSARLDSLRGFLSVEPVVAWRPMVPKEQRHAGTLDSLCASAGVKFVVTREDLSAPPLATAPDEAGKGFAGLKLYGCDAPVKPALSPADASAGKTS